MMMMMIMMMMIDDDYDDYDDDDDDDDKLGRRICTDGMKDLKVFNDSKLYYVI